MSEVKTEPKHSIDARGKWVIVDTTPLGVSLLAVGGNDYQGISLRNALSEESRSVLLAHIKRTAADGTDISVLTAFRGAEFTVETRAIWSPDHKQVLGCLAYYDTPGTPPPALPLIGSWQWRVDRTTGKNVGDDSSIWHPNLFKIYGITPEIIRSSRGPAGDWLTKLVSTKDRQAIKLVIDSGVSVNNRDRHLLSYEVIYGYGTPNPSKKQISNSARAYEDPDYPSAIMLRGFSREVKRPADLITPGLSPVSPGLIVDTMFALANDVAFAVIDLAQEITAQTSASWAELGLTAEYEGNLAALAHPDDKSTLEAHLQGAAAGAIRPSETVPVRLRTVSSSWRRFELAAAPIEIDVERSRYLTASLKPMEV